MAGRPRDRRLAGLKPAQLYEQRDLAPTSDVRAVLKGRPVRPFRRGVRRQDVSGIRRGEADAGFHRRKKPGGVTGDATFGGNADTASEAAPRRSAPLSPVVVPVVVVMVPPMSRPDYYHATTVGHAISPPVHVPARAASPADAFDWQRSGARLYHGQGLRADARKRQCACCDCDWQNVSGEHNRVLHGSTFTRQYSTQPAEAVQMVPSHIR